MYRIMRKSVGPRKGLERISTSYTMGTGATFTGAKTTGA
jgi:hypothetical protein